MTANAALTPSDDALAPLFAPLAIGAIEAPHRVLMAPLTRNRAHGDGAPNEMAIEYYRQRAGAGLIFTEATQISPMGKGYLDTPGVHDAKHVDGWRKIVDAVHDAGGRIVLQLWHVGRISHVSLLPPGERPLAPSAVRAAAQTFGPNGFVDVSEPRAMSLDDIATTIAEYRTAAENAKAAGFDGVETHAANGYLIDQFLRDGSNKRDDDYGGSADNRTRFLREAVGAAVDVFGADRVGVRLSPTGAFNDMSDSDPASTFAAAVDALNDFGLAYLHMVETFPGEESSADDKRVVADLKKRWKGAYIANGGFDATSAAEAIRNGDADAVAFGRPYIANPDLPVRYARGAALNEPDQDTFYGGGAEGYTDYPFLED